MDKHAPHSISVTITMKAHSNTLETEKQLKELWMHTFHECLGIPLREQDITAEIFPPCASTHRDDPPFMYPQCVTINLQYSPIFRETPEEIAGYWIRTFRKHIGWPLSSADVHVETNK